MVSTTLLTAVHWLSGGIYPVWLLTGRHKKKNFASGDVELLPPGLSNISGNLCFLNALLQALASFPCLLLFLDRVHEALNAAAAEPTAECKKHGLVPESLRCILLYLNRVANVHYDTVQDKNNEIHNAFSTLRQYYEAFYSRTSISGRPQTLHHIGQQDLHEALHAIFEYLRFNTLPFVQRLRCYPFTLFSYRRFMAWPLGFSLFNNRYLGSLGGAAGDGYATYVAALNRAECQQQHDAGILVGRLEHTLECKDCQWKSVTSSTEEFLVMELALPSSSTTVSDRLSLYSLLEAHYKTPIAVSAVRCPSCALRKISLVNTAEEKNASLQQTVTEAKQMLSRGISWKKIISKFPLLHAFFKTQPIPLTTKLYTSTITQLPDCLSIHLQRNCLMYGYVEKNATCVEFPLLLDLTFLIQQQRNTTSMTQTNAPSRWVYQLRAVVEHVGALLVLHALFV